MRMKGLNSYISQTYRESNKVADGLANLACDLSTNSTFHQSSDLPQDIKVAIFMDRLDLLSIRMSLFFGVFFC